MRFLSTLPALAALATVTLVKAQTGSPTYLGALLVQPGATSSLCLSAASDTDGAIVTTETCTGANTQKWTFADGALKTLTNKCLDVKDGNTTNGAKLQIWTCFSGSTNQQFYYNFWSNQLSWKDKGKCVDLSGGRTTTGNQIQLWACNGNGNQIWNTGYMANALPAQTQNGQTGYNNCNGANSATAKCQTAWMNSLNDFCLWGPDTVGTIGDTERNVVAWCTNKNRGARSIPNGALTGVHFVKTKNYVQVTGAGDFTKINIPSGDDGGEMDPHGPDGNGNPVGGIVYGNTFGASLQYHEWTSFMSDREFCFRACVGPDARTNCQHIYDVMGCWWNMPANYNAGTFEECNGDNALPMGVYGTSTWFQGVSPTPAAHPVPASSNCNTQATVTAASISAKKRRELRYVRAPQPTAPPS
jgi:hypothetical protein